MFFVKSYGTSLKYCQFTKRVKEKNQKKYKKGKIFKDQNILSKNSLF